LQLKQEQEKCRVLEEALNVLAKEHHELEQSMASHLSASPSLQEQRCSSLHSRRSPRFYDTSDDEFYDAFEAGMFIISPSIVPHLLVWIENNENLKIVGRIYVAKKRRLMVFEDSVLTRIYGPKRDEVTVEWRTLHNEELLDFYPCQI
jgi:hypothetical protein